MGNLKSKINREIFENLSNFLYSESIKIISNPNLVKFQNQDIQIYLSQDNISEIVNFENVSYPSYTNYSLTDSNELILNNEINKRIINNIGNFVNENINLFSKLFEKNKGGISNTEELLDFFRYNTVQNQENQNFSRYRLDLNNFNFTSDCSDLILDFTNNNFLILSGYYNANFIDLKTDSLILLIVSCINKKILLTIQNTPELLTLFNIDDNQNSDNSNQELSLTPIFFILFLLIIFLGVFIFFYYINQKNK